MGFFLKKSGNFPIFCNGLLPYVCKYNFNPIPVVYEI